MSKSDKMSRSRSASLTVQTDDSNTPSQGKNKAVSSRKSQVQAEHCVTCHSDVGDDNSLPCDFCGKYTHLKCDKTMSNALYQALTENQPNPLLYFCSECKPMLVPKQSKNLWSGFLDRVAKATNTTQKHKSLADHIMDTMSLKIEHLDDLVREHRATSELAKTEMKNLVGEQRSLVREAHAALDNAHSHNRDTLEESSAALALTRSVLNEMYSRTNDRDDPTPSYTRPIPKPRHTQPRPHTFPSYSYVTSQHPPNVVSNGRGPTTHVIPKPDTLSPDPDTTLVLYNANQQNIQHIIEDLMLKCRIYQYEVIGADCLSRSGDPNKPRPAYIRCDHARTKWNFIREINKLRQTDPAYKQIYARPYLTNEDLRTDRNLYRKLLDIRKRHMDRTFKIYKGDIYEKTDDSFEKYDASTVSTDENGSDHTPHATTTDSNDAA